jgi:CheY-like chemotaxis protein/HPt (histidine-containing phosphotransfer) domain-containing protein
MSPHDSEQVQAADSTPQGRETPALKPLRVLVVEDNAVNQRVLTLQLERAGHSVHLAVNGREALEILKGQRFDLVLMDLQMPEMDGLRTTQLIRAQERAFGGHVPVIAVTAHNLPEERRRCLAVGMDEYLVKPIRAAELHAAIARVLGFRSETAVPPAGEGSGNGVWADLVKGLGFPSAAVARLTQAFLDEVPARMKRLREALAAGDAPGVKDAAHSLKGTLMIFGQGPGVKAAYELEMQARQGQLAADSFTVLEAEVGKLLREMTSFQQESP